MFISFAVLLILVIINGLFAATEIAMISLNHNRLKKKAEDGNKRAQKLKRLVETPETFLATIQIGISLVGLFSGAFAAQSFAVHLAAILHGLFSFVPESALVTISTLVITLVLSYFTLVFGELVPKRIAMKKADDISLWAVSPLLFLSGAAKPFVKMLSASTNAIVSLFGIDPRSANEDVTEEEIRLLVDAGGETGMIDEDEMEMINNIFEFNDKTAADICIHRTEMTALPVDITPEELVDELKNLKFSRIPIFEETIDNIIGILYTKDLLKFLLSGTEKHVDLKYIIRKPYFIPFSKKADDLFDELRKNQMHMAIVIDEYGGTLGIVTMEDLIEEVMGNIFDEHDAREIPDIVTIDENTFTINGATDLSDVSEHLDVELPVDEYDTIGGFIISLLGRIPEEGERPEAEFNGLLFKVEQVEEKRISLVTVCKV